MGLSIIFFLVVLMGVATWSVMRKRLTIGGGMAAVIVASAIFAGTGWEGVLLLGCFFITGTLATSWKKEKKKREAEDSEQRTAGQVIANGGLAALCGISAYFFPQQSYFFQLLIAACFSAAIADTLSSELGMAYGKNFYNILNFKKDEKGENGVISIEGTLTGIAASALIALLFGLANNDHQYFFPIIVAGFAGNTMDSLLGATLEKNKIVGNNGVNFLNTLTAAIVMWLLIS